MDGGPGEPREESAETNFVAFQNGEVLADDGHVSLIEISERTRGTGAGDARVDQLASIASLLHGDLRNAGQRLPVVIERRSISHDKNLGMAGHGKVFLYPDPAGVVCFHAQPFTRGRRSYPGGPYDGPARNALAGDRDPA